MVRNLWAHLVLALPLLAACSFEDAPAPVQKFGHNLAATSNRVGDGIRTKVVPSIKGLAARNPWRGEKDKNPAPGLISTQYRRAKPSEMRTPGHYYLYDLYSEYRCPGAEGDKSSYISAMNIDTVTPAAYNLGNTCKDGSPIPATEYPYDLQKNWMSAFVKRNLVVYRSRIWNLEHEPKKSFKDMSDSFVLCENDKQDLAFYVMRDAGRYWGFIGWKEAATDAKGKPDPRYRTSRFFPVETEFRESTLVEVKSTNGAVSGRIMTARSPSGTHPGTFHFDGVEAIANEVKYAPLNCTVGHLFHEGSRPRFVDKRDAEADRFAGF